MVSDVSVVRPALDKVFSNLSTTDLELLIILCLKEEERFSRVIANRNYGSSNLGEYETAMRAMRDIAAACGDAISVR